MKRILLMVALLWGLPVLLLAQKENLNWIIRDNCHIQFNADSSYTIHKMKYSQWDYYSSHECHAAYSDTNGQLLFYLHAKQWTSKEPPFNYSVLKDRNQDTIPNGDNIYADYSITNGATFIKYQDKVYLFHLNKDHYRLELDGPVSNYNDSTTRIDLRYTVLEKLNEKWTVTKKNVLVSGDKRLVEKLALVRHANGTDWWIITHDFNQDVFHLFLFQNGEITYSFSQNAGNAFKKKKKGIAPPYTGEISVAPDGSKFIMAYQGVDLDPNGYDTEIFNFDRCSGNIELYKTIKDKKFYGASFSPNGKFVYLCKLYGFTYQYEIDAPDIDSTAIQISPQPPYNRDWGWGGAQMELGPDGKIYCAAQSALYLAAIEFPDKKGLDCGFKPDALFADSLFLGGIGLPTFPNYRLGKMEPQYIRHDTAVCANKIATIGLPAKPNDTAVYAYQWSPTIGLSDSTAEIARVLITQPTTYVRRTYSKLFGCTVQYDTFVVTLRNKQDSICLVSREKVVSKNYLEMYPNPASESVSLRYQFSEATQAEVAIMNVTGMQVGSYTFEGRVGTYEIPLHKLTNGVYLVRIKLSNGNTVSEKLVLFKP